jgi:methylated-DNA-[protein]-cysteine S-methyltransferase
MLQRCDLLVHAGDEEGLGPYRFHSDPVIFKQVPMPTQSGPAATAVSKNAAPAKLRRGFTAKISLLRFQAILDTAFGLVGVRTESDALAEVVYLPRSAGTLAPTNALAERACAQIEKYGADPGYRFRLPLKEVGTAFQRRVWDMIASIPCGQTKTYGDIARILHSAPRAVGQACGTNYFPLVIPCHRVVAANGLGGFAHSSSGYLLEVKRWLLAHESHGNLS